MTKEQAKQRAEIMLAWVNGETIQYKLSAGEEWADNRSSVIRDFDFDSVQYRIKPAWALSNHIPGFRPLREGEKWWMGMEGYKEEWLIGGYRPLLKSEMDGKRHKDVEYAWSGTPVPEDKGWWADPTDTGNFRTKRPLPEPKPKLKTVPLEAGDVPLTSLIRINAHTVASVVAINNGHVVSSDKFQIIPMDVLMSNGWEIRRPGSTTWEKCEKIVEEKGEV